MPNKSINAGILRKYHSKDHRVNTMYYQKHQNKDFSMLRSKWGEGTHIGNLAMFKADQELHKSSNPPMAKLISKVNDKLQFKAPKGFHERNNLFIFGQKKINRPNDDHIAGG